MDVRKTAAIEFSLDWQSDYARHCDRYYMERVDFWRDIFPGDMGTALSGMSPGQNWRETFPAGTLTGAYSERSVMSVPRRLFSSDAKDLQTGRFYPQGSAWKSLNTYPTNMAPMRLLETGADTLVVDTNLPLARFSVEIQAEIMQTGDAGPQRGGAVQDIAELLTGSGPGMQIPLQRTGFYDSGTYPYSRENDGDDALFYHKPRMVHHLDDTARRHVRSLYGRLLRPGERVLDLMSSWHSHFPASHASCQVTGIGLNAEEMLSNDLLQGYVLRDLNREPLLPFQDQSFDAAVCTASIEYLCRPREVMSELARIIRPGGLFAATFSDRWFPGKEIAPWADLHPFERQGMVLNYMLNEPEFSDIHTESMRGYPRPAGDRHSRQTPLSDPVYTVWARRRS